MAAVVDVLETRLELTGLSRYAAGLGQVSKLHDRLGVIAASTGAAAAAGMFLISQATRDAAKEQTSLNRAVANFKGQWSATGLGQFVSDLQDLTAVDEGQIADTLGLLGTFQVSPGSARRLALPILNATEALKAQGATAEQVAVQVGKALQTGEPTALRRSGIILDEVAFKAADAEERVRLLAQALQSQGGDAAINFRNSPEGAVRRLELAIGDVREEFGKPLTGGMMVLSDFLTGAAKGFSELPGPIKTVISYVGVGFVGAMGLASAATGAATIAQTKYLAELLKVTAAQKLAGATAVEMGAKQQAAAAAAATTTTISTAAATAAYAGLGATGTAGAGLAVRGTSLGARIAGAAGRAGAAIGRIGGGLVKGGPAAMLALDTIDSFTGPNPWTGKNKDMPGAAIARMAERRGLVKPQSQPDAMLAEQKKTNELLQKQTEVMQQGGGDYASTGFLPIAAQRGATRSFARRMR